MADALTLLEQSNEEVSTIIYIYGLKFQRLTLFDNSDLSRSRAWVIDKVLSK